MTKGQRKYRGGWAIMTIDPGGTTGVAKAYVPKRPTVAQSLKDAKKVAEEVKGTYLEQAVQIALDWLDFSAKAQLKYKIPRDRNLLVIESFQLRQRNVDLDPVRVLCALQGLLIQHDAQLIEQIPSNAKTFATDSRLRNWGLWEVGSAHKRDAFRHLALAVAGRI